MPEVKEVRGWEVCPECRSEDVECTPVEPKLREELGFGCKFPDKAGGVDCYCFRCGAHEFIKERR